jgi:hypothetical protein
VTVDDRVASLIVNLLDVEFPKRSTHLIASLALARQPLRVSRFSLRLAPAVLGRSRSLATRPAARPRLTFRSRNLTDLRFAP